MKILLVSPLPPPSGGIATWTVMYKDYCEQHGIPLHIVNNALQGKRAAKTSNRHSIVDELKRMLHVLRSFRKVLRNEKPDVVHLNTSCTKYGMIRDCMCVRMAKKARVPVMLHCRCNIEDQLKGKMAVKAFQRACKMAARVLVLNHSSQQYARQYAGDKVIIVPLFVGREKILPRDTIAPEIKKVLYVGHVRREKGTPEILETARHFSDIQFQLIGPVQEDIRQLPCPDNVEMPGNQPLEQLQQYLREADLFLFPSHTEGFSNALAEAMAAGLPVICTDVGANKIMIEDRGGIIVPVGNSEEIISAIQSLNGNQALRGQMSAWNLEKVRSHYLLDAVMETLLTLYKEVAR